MSVDMIIISYLLFCLQFQTFSERLADINIDVIRQVGKSAEVPEVSDQKYHPNRLGISNVSIEKSFSPFFYLTSKLNVPVIDRLLL